MRGEVHRSTLLSQCQREMKRRVPRGLGPPTRTFMVVPKSHTRRQEQGKISLHQDGLRPLHPAVTASLWPTAGPQLQALLLRVLRGSCRGRGRSFAHFQRLSGEDCTEANAPRWRRQIGNTCRCLHGVYRTCRYASRLLIEGAEIFQEVCEIFVKVLNISQNIPI